MLTYAVVAYAIGSIVSVAGIGLVIRSLVSASRRGQPVFARFWAPAEMLAADELRDNRLGFALCFLGLAILAIPIYLLA
jgi:hypothetical protein